MLMFMMMAMVARMASPFTTIMNFFANSTAYYKANRAAYCRSCSRTRCPADASTCKAANETTFQKAFAATMMMAMMMPCAPFA